MNYRFITASLPIAFLSILLFSNSCKKAEPNVSPKQPDQPTKASKNNIDSVLGTYYGWTRTYVHESSSGNTQSSNVYDGRDTIVLVKRNDSTVEIQYGSYQPHLLAPTGTDFVFDSSGVMQRFGGGSTLLTINTAVDSLEFNFSYSDIGRDVYANFKGKK
jgi:hypothetical protein